MPAGLCSAAEKLWKDTIKRWEVDDVAALSHLANACRSLTRLRSLEHVLEREGLMVDGRFGKVRNPAHATMLGESRNFREHMRQLQLDIESLYSADEEGD
jgi:hypothetical protein